MAEMGKAYVSPKIFVNGKYVGSGEITVNTSPDDVAVNVTTNNEKQMFVATFSSLAVQTMEQDDGILLSVTLNGKTNFITVDEKSWEVPEFRNAALHKSICEVAKKLTQEYVINNPHWAEPVEPEESYADWARGIMALVPDITKIRVSCPACDSTDEEVPKTDIWTCIVDLNDDHKWTREQIADWLDTLHDSGIIDLTLKQNDQDKA
jgi:hypothetical protein